MNISFWITLILMTLGATGFLVLPALRHVNASDSRSQTPFLVVAVVVPILTIALYANIGSPRAAVADTGSRGAPAARTMTQAGARVAQSYRDCYLGCYLGCCLGCYFDPDKPQGR